MAEYDHIVGPNTINKGITHAYVWVIPKSGGVFLSIFFNVYSDLLNTKYPTEKQLEYSHPNINLFGKTEFVVEHAECPGYAAAETNPAMLKLWSAIKYHDHNWSGNETRRKRLSAALATSPAQNLGRSDGKFLSKCKAVFVYRNVLDQAVSYFGHREPGNNSLQGLENTIFKLGSLESYVKVFYSFHITKNKHPDMILFVPYEEIINNKKVALRRIINHLGIPYEEKAFLKAIELTSMDNLKSIENKAGHSLLNPNSSSKHIKNGSVGFWQKKMTPDMVQRVETYMNQFGLSLKMFYLADTLDSKFSFLATQNTSKPKLKP